MTRHGPALLALSLIAVAGWTYNVNYDTRAALERLSKLRAEIAEQREALQVLRVEWAYLNAPDRLEQLVARHNGALGLVPLVPEGLGIVAAIPYPPRHGPESAPMAPEALIAAAPPAKLPPEPAPVATPSVAPSTSSVAIEPASWRPIRPAAPEAAAEVVPATLEAAIDAALAEVGVSAEDGRPGVPKGGVLSVPAGPGAGLFAASASGVPVPAARPAAWSGR